MCVGCCPGNALRLCVCVCVCAAFFFCVLLFVLADEGVAYFSCTLMAKYKCIKSISFLQYQPSVDSSQLPDFARLCEAVVWLFSNWTDLPREVLCLISLLVT